MRLRRFVQKRSRRGEIMALLELDLGWARSSPSGKSLAWILPVVAGGAAALALRARRSPHGRPPDQGRTVTPAPPSPPAPAGSAESDTVVEAGPYVWPAPAEEPSPAGQPAGEEPRQRDATDLPGSPETGVDVPGSAEEMRSAAVTGEATMAVPREAPIAVPSSAPSAPSAREDATTVDPASYVTSPAAPGLSVPSALPGPAVLGSAARIVQQKKYEITKAWLTRLIGRIDDLSALQTFPIKESIDASLDLIEGVGASLEDQMVLKEFDPGGHYYEQAAKLGRVHPDDPDGMARLTQTLGELEDAVWAAVGPALEEHDREVLLMGGLLRGSLRRVTAAAAQSYHAQSSSRLDRLAYSDPLTGLNNRRYLVQQLERHLEVYKRYKRPFSVLMIDLDRLKWVNDTFGHHKGDCALRFIAGLMRINMRDVDILGRLGGDEFAVIMPEADRRAAEVAGHRLARSVHETPFKLDSSFVKLSISFGAAACPQDGRDAETLMRAADTGLYRAKRNKRNEM